MKNTSPQTLPEWPTKDIYLATVIKQAGIPIIRVENHGGRGIFVFQGSEKIQVLINKYFNNALKVDPRGLFETWKGLKSMAFSTIGDVR
jgi:hypothetical protein